MLAVACARHQADPAVARDVGGVVAPPDRVCLRVDVPVARAVDIDVPVPCCELASRLGRAVRAEYSVALVPYDAVSGLGGALSVRDDAVGADRIRPPAEVVPPPPVRVGQPIGLAVYPVKDLRACAA